MRCAADGTALAKAEYISDPADSVPVQGQHPQEPGPLRDQERVGTVGGAGRCQPEGGSGEAARATTDRRH